jgi:hypothetical protein
MPATRRRPNSRLARRVLQAIRMRNLLFVLFAGACATSKPMSPAVCNDVLSHYAQGESLDKIATDFRLGDRDAARDAVHQAMISLQKRYYHDR